MCTILGTGQNAKKHDLFALFSVPCDEFSTFFGFFWLKRCALSSSIICENSLILATFYDPASSIVYTFWKIRKLRFLKKIKKLCFDILIGGCWTDSQSPCHSTLAPKISARSGQNWPTWFFHFRGSKDVMSVGPAQKIPKKL